MNRLLMLINFYQATCWGLLWADNDPESCQRIKISNRKSTNVQTLVVSPRQEASIKFPKLQRPEDYKLN